MWLSTITLLFLVPFAESDRFEDDLVHVSATDFARRYCPQCKPIKTGDFRSYWVIYHYWRGEHYLQQTHIDKEMNEGIRILPRGFLGMILHPIILNGKYEPIMVEQENGEYLKMYQVFDAKNKYKYQPYKGLVFKTPQLCMPNPRPEGQFESFDPEKSFVYKDRYIASLDRAIDVKTACNKDVIETSAHSYFKSNGPKGYNEKWLKDCFDKRIPETCVINLDSGNAFHRTEKYPIYMRNDVLVYVYCVADPKPHYERRCVYFLEDTVTKTEWYIPDSIEFSKKVLTGLHNIQLLLPLIQLDDPFFKTERRFEYSNVPRPIKTSTKKLTTSTTQTTTTTIKITKSSTSVTMPTTITTASATLPTTITRTSAVMSTTITKTSATLPTTTTTNKTTQSTTSVTMSTTIAKTIATMSTTIAKTSATLPTTVTRTSAPTVAKLTTTTVELEEKVAEERKKKGSDRNMKNYIILIMIAIYFLFN